jgi:hypothetical protein
MSHGKIGDDPTSRVIRHPFRDGDQVISLKIPFSNQGVPIASEGVSAIFTKHHNSASYIKLPRGGQSILLDGFTAALGAKEKSESGNLNRNMEYVQSGPACGFWSHKLINISKYRQMLPNHDLSHRQQCRSGPVAPRTTT